MMPDLTTELDDLAQMYNWDEQEGRRPDEMSAQFHDQVKIAPSKVPLPETGCWQITSFLPFINLANLSTQDT